MGWMTGKRSWADWLILGPILAYCWVHDTFGEYARKKKRIKKEESSGGESK